MCSTLAFTVPLPHTYTLSQCTAAYAGLHASPQRHESVRGAGHGCAPPAERARLPLPRVRCGVDFRKGLCSRRHMLECGVCGVCACVVCLRVCVVRSCVRVSVASRAEPCWVCGWVWSRLSVGSIRGSDVCSSGLLLPSSIPFPHPHPRPPRHSALPPPPTALWNPPPGDHGPCH